MNSRPDHELYVRLSISGISGVSNLKDLQSLSNELTGLGLTPNVDCEKGRLLYDLKLPTHESCTELVANIGKLLAKYMPLIPEIHCEWSK